MVIYDNFVSTEFAFLSMLLYFQSKKRNRDTMNIVDMLRPVAPLDRITASQLKGTFSYLPTFESKYSCFLHSCKLFNLYSYSMSPKGVTFQFSLHFLFALFHCPKLLIASLKSVSLRWLSVIFLSVTFRAVSKSCTPSYIIKMLLVLTLFTQVIQTRSCPWLC